MAAIWTAAGERYGDMWKDSCKMWRWKDLAGASGAPICVPRGRYVCCGTGSES